MPSPFPGMDPYIEGDLWTSFHSQLGVEIARQLVPLLRPKYVALPAKRFVMSFPEAEDDIVVTSSTYPDVGIATANPSATSPGTAAVSTAPLHLATMIPEPIPHISVEIRDVAGRQLVTALEILSPTNKRPGDGRDEYLERRRRILLSSAHLVEIDLLHQGQRVPMQRPLPPAAYFVLLSRASIRPLMDVWPIRVADPLPVLPIPLLPGDDDVPLDLQNVVNAVFDFGAYDLLIDYTKPCPVPLTESEARFLTGR